MSNFFPIVLDATANKIEELPSGDNLDLTGSGLYNNGANIALPTVTGTLATLAGSETMSNKIFSGNISFTGNLQLEGLANIRMASGSGIKGNVSFLTTTEPTIEHPTVGAIQLSGGAAIAGNVAIGRSAAVIGGLAVGQAFNDTSLFDIPLLVKGSPDGLFTQGAIISAKATASADLAAYANNYGEGGLSGFADMGITGNLFTDPTYSITNSNDGYFFVSAADGAGLGGNLVLATDHTGTHGDVIIAVGSFYSNAEVARFHGNALTGGYFALNQGTAATSTTTGALRINGGLGVTETVYADTFRGNIAGDDNGTSNVFITGSLIPTSNITYNLGTSTNRFKDLWLSGSTIYLDSSSIQSVDGDLTITNGGGATFTVSGTSGTGSTGTFGNLVANSGAVSNSTSSGALVVTGGAGVSGNVHVGQNLVVTGDLTVNGTTTTLNTSVLEVEDLNVTVAKGAGSAAAADGAGLTVDAAGATLIYANADDSWNFNKLLNGTSAAFNTATLGGLQAKAIGNVTPGTGAFTSVTVGETSIGDGTVGTGTLTSGTGNVTYLNVGQASSLNTATAASLQAVTIGNVTPGTGVFTSLTASSTVVNGTVTASVINAPTIGNSGAAITGTIQTAAQTNITSVGTLTGLTASGLTTLDTVAAGSYQGTIGNVTPAAGTFTSLVGSSAVVNGTVTASIINAPTIGNSGATLTGTIQTAAQTNITSVGTLTALTVSGVTHVTDETASTASTNGALIVSGGVGIGGNLYVAGNINFTGQVNATTFNVSSGSFIGNTTTGYGALYAGIPSGYAELPSTPFQIATNANTYSQMNMQNINSGLQASTDLVITAHNGSDSTYYGNFGIASSTYDYPELGLSAIGGNDVYILGVGYNGLGPYTGNVGNVVISSSNGKIKLATGGGNEENVVAEVTGTALRVLADTTSTTTTSGALQVIGGTGISGNLNVGGVTYITDTTNAVPYVMGSGAFHVAGGISIGKDIWVGGNLYVANVVSQSTTFLEVAAPLVYLETPEVYPYNYDIGVFSHFTGGPANVYAHTGVVRSYENGYWGFFSNVAEEPGPTGRVEWADGGIIWDKIKAGALELANTTASTSTTTGALTVAGGVGIAGAAYAGSVYDNGTRVVSTSTGGGNLTITSGAISLTATGPGAASVGSSTAIPVITTDAYGRVTATSTASVVAPAGTLSGSTLASGVTASSLTSVGTLNGLTVTGSSTFGKINAESFQGVIGNVTPASGTFTGITVSGSILPSSNASINIGGTSSWFNIIYGKSVQAQYADLAENYSADAEYAPGTVLMFGGDTEVTVANEDTTAVAGVVSTNPAYLMNGELSGTNVVALALTGRVPCKVMGPVRKGNMLVSAGNGYARAESNPAMGSVIGKALENFDGFEGVIEVVVGRL